MTGTEPRAILEHTLLELAEARRHLDYSFAQVKDLPVRLSGATEAQLESVEAFTSRFARSVDLLVNKVLRALDRVELKPQGTLLDVVNRAEKRGFVATASELREMKDVRNVIAHDYAGRKLPEIYLYCLDQKPIFDRISDQAAAYAEPLIQRP
ncbi:MAG: hypothetical protein O2960_16905 [Verrucomicrobia bacterium]|nr:hypothetical protein [Verrucomicrobiota bacterium]